MLLECRIQYASKFGKLSSSHRTGKGQFIPIPKKGKAKECSNYYTTVIISHGSKVMLKILQVRFQQYMNWELPDVQPGFRKGIGTRSQIVNICWITGEARGFRKIPISVSSTMPKPLTVWKTINCGKFLKRWEYQTLPASWETYMQVKKQQKQTWNNGLVPNGERSTSRQYIVILLN